MRSKQSRSILFQSDMHVGSIHAVRSPDAEVEDGSTFKNNKFCEKIYNDWCNVRDKVHDNHKNLDLFVINGEPIDGGNMRTNGGGTWTSNINKQMDDAERLIDQYKRTNLVMTRGSRYHVSQQNMSHEEVLARKLGAVPYSGFGNDFTDNYLWFTMNDKLFSVCHHVGYNKTELYRTTALGREMAVMEFARGKWYPKDMNVDVLVRSHVHYYVQIRFPGQIAFTTPCWKMPDEFQMRRGLGGTAVHIGSIELVVEQNGKIEVVEHIIKSDDYPKPRILEF